MTTPQSKSAIGLIGLATMGENLARNIANHGFTISVFNRTTEKTEKFIKNFAKDYPLLHGTFTLKDFVASLEAPRKIILLVKAGSPVDEIIAEISPLLDKNDILVDCGNSHFKDTERRQLELAKKSIHLIGCGISGGEEGALRGPSLMPGGNKSAWEKIEKIFTAIAADVPVDNSPSAKSKNSAPSSKCVAYIGPAGSGHFVKMVHNGIEYAIMQLIAETYDILKNIGEFSNPELAEIFKNYGKTENLKSFLMEITAIIFTRTIENLTKPANADHQLSKNSSHLIDLIKDSAGQKGTGKWTTEAALNLGVAIPTINAAVDARIISGDNKGRAMCKILKRNISSKKLTSSTKKNLLTLVKDSLELATILAYEQGIGLLTKAGKEFSWNLDLSEITRIWQGGCIIRSNYLKTLTIGLGKDKEPLKNTGSRQNSQSFHKSAAKEVMQKMVKLFAGPKQKNWRKLLALAIEHGIPVPAFYASLNFYDSYSAQKLPQNLIQAQRDFFGAHGYERTDKPGWHHTEW